MEKNDKMKGAKAISIEKKAFVQKFVFMITFLIFS